MFTLNCNKKLLFINEPLIMGIINVTPDSFYSDSRKENITAVITTATNMLAHGAGILDIGGQSTRPGSEQVSAQKEANRIIPAISAIKDSFPDVYISVDTYYAEVAAAALEAGADIINDISAGRLDKEIIEVAAHYQAPYILMHMQGTPQNMQQNPVYSNVTTSVLDFFIEKMDTLRNKGITDIIVDPGIGFGKTAAHNFELIKNLSAFTITQCPILLGVSRKSFIYKTLNITADTALNGTTVLNTIGLQNGASILRVHDVREAQEAVQLLQQINKA